MDCGIGDQEALISSLDSGCAGAGQVAYLGPEASRAPTKSFVVHLESQGLCKKLLCGGCFHLVRDPVIIHEAFKSSISWS